MNVTVFGASGHVGRLVVKRLLASGHMVRAFVHSSSPFDDRERLIVVHGDVHLPSDVEQALNGADAVISCLGSWHTPTKDILSSAMKTIIPVAEKMHIDRVISLTGSAACAPEDAPRLIDRINRAMLRKVAPQILGDGEQHINLLAESALNWVVIRSPIMTSFGNTSYHLNMHSPSPFATVSRAAVAQAMVDVLSDRQYDGTAPHIHASS